MREKIAACRTWVVKIGSSLLTDAGLGNGTSLSPGPGLDREAIAGWAAQIARLREAGLKLVIVSSGAVAEGANRLGLGAMPRELRLQAAAAAVGQMGVIEAWESCFSKHGVRTAQILLSHEDLSNRTRYLNARSTLTSLLKLGAVPVINENDSVATEELCLGDNDNLAALVSNLINADVMVNLTDQDGLFSADPRKNEEATLIGNARAGDPALDRLAGAGGSLGRGGMITKLSAARLAARSGTHTIIANGREADLLPRLREGAEIGTWLSAENEPVTARKQWLAGQLTLKGSLMLDAGAVRVLRSQGKSLLAVGITATEGSYRRGEVVACLDASGREIARGMVNYDSGEVAKLLGQDSSRIADVLGYAGEEEIIHRDNLVLAC
ncbi:MAG: glutamate 5-kinase [Gammaproteobacteria bacterium]|nr:glutamate 5-kinase [Gammaproteobacteria bacterium]